MHQVCLGTPFSLCCNRSKGPDMQPCRKSAQNRSLQRASGVVKSEYAPSSPLASSIPGISGSSNSPAAAFGALTAASTRQYPWRSASSGLTGYPWVGAPMQRFQGSAGPSLSFIENLHSAKDNWTPPAAAPPSCVDPTSNNAGDPGGSFEDISGDIGSVTKLATANDPPSSLSPSPLQSLGSSLMSAAARADSYIPSPPPFGSFSSTEPATSSVDPSPLPTLGNLGIDLKLTVANASSRALSSSAIKRLRSSTESTTARISSSLSSPSLLEDLGGSLPSAMASARSYMPSEPPSLQSLRSHAVSAAAVVTAPLSSPSPLGSLTNNLKSAAASAGSYVLSPSPFKSLGSGSEPGAISAGASSSSALRSP